MPDTFASASLLIPAMGAACVALIHWLRKTTPVSHNNEVAEAERKLEGLELELAVAEDLGYAPATLNNIQAQVATARMAVDIARINAQHQEKLKEKPVSTPVPRPVPQPGREPVRTSSKFIRKLVDDDKND